MTTSTEMRQERAKIINAMSAIQKALDRDKRDFTIAERETWENLEREVRRLDGAIAREEAQLSREAALARSLNNNGRSIAPHDHHFSEAIQQSSLFEYVALGGGLQGVDTGRAKEMSEEAAKRSGRTFQGVALPDEIFYRRREKRAIVTTSEGGDWIGTDHRDDLFVNMLYEKLALTQLGVTIIDNLQSDVDIPRQTGSGGAEFFADNSPITLTNMTADKLEASPKLLGSLHEFSKKMVMQSQPAVERLAASDMIASHAVAIDRCALEASTVNGPTGLLGLGIDNTVTMTPPTWAGVLGLIERVEDSNSDGTGFLTRPAVVRALRSTPKVLNTDSAMIQEAPRELAGYPLASTMICPPDHLFFGRWSDLLILRWATFDLLVNPFGSPQFSKGNVEVRLISAIDVKVRHIESFAVSGDVDTGEPS